MLVDETVPVRQADILAPHHRGVSLFMGVEKREG